MKKLNGRWILYGALLLLLAVTVWMGGNGSGMIINYLFLIFMGILIFCMDIWGLSGIRAMTDDLKDISDRILAGKYGREPGKDNLYYLDQMEKMDFRQQAANGDWHRLLKDWRESDGIDCDVEDYLFEDEMFEYCNYNICAQVPGILTAMGILGTFLGLVLGLQNFDFSNTDQMTSSVEALVGGLNVAFYTSIYGVSLSIIYNMIFRHIVTAMSRELNHLYDVFHTVLKPSAQKDIAEKLCHYEDEQNALLMDVRELLNERFGEHLAGQMAETLMPVFERITRSLDHMILDFHKEQADSLEKIVDAFVEQMSVALNSHVNVLGESVDRLSSTQKDMSAELQQLIRQIKRTGTDTAKINEQAGEILGQLSGYVPQLEKTARDSAEIIAQMGQWSESIKAMSRTQSEILKTLSVHEGNLDTTCEKINSSQEALNSRLMDFTEAAKVLAEREKDPLQYAELKDMLTAYMGAMQQLQNSNTERMENLWRQMASDEARQQENINQIILEQMRDILKAQQDMVYLNGRIAGILSGQSKGEKIKLPSGAASSVEEQWMKQQSEKMDAWMEAQMEFQKQILAMAAAGENRSFLARIREFFAAEER